MIVSSLRHKIKGLDELFKYLPKNYNFHDAGLVSLNWDIEKEELTVTYSCYHGIDKDNQHLYLVTFHLIPEMNDFEIYMSPHNPYTNGIDLLIRTPCYQNIVLKQMVQGLLLIAKTSGSK